MTHNARPSRRGGWRDGVMPAEKTKAMMSAKPTLLAALTLALLGLACEKDLSLAESNVTKRGQTAGAGLSPEQQRRALKKHNDLRSQVAGGDTPGQPPAADMKRLVWDDELAAVAQSWAEECRYAHNEQRGEQLKARTSVEEPEVGENLFAFLGTMAGPDIDAAIQEWFDEQQMYRFGNPIPATGHYTQLVWADTSRVGCGYARCDELAAPPFAEMPARAEGFILVCDYAPAGNWIGQDPYTVGTACSACADARSRCVDGLCSPP